MAQQLKNRWSVGHNFLTGITAGTWWRLLRENRFSVDAPYWHRAAFISGISLINSFFKQIESFRFDKDVAATEITEPPLFVLGHWRSGTTHLHNLLSLDTKQFAYPNTYQVVSPNTFLATERVCTRLFSWLVPKKRPMDNMALSFAAPQEEDMGLALMCLKSVLLAVNFPRNEARYSPYMTFEGVPEEEVDEWRTAMQWFVRKLTYKYGRAIVLKSPANTARIALLQDLFPGARFVHIHRHPYEVFQSTRHYFNTAMWYTYLQRPLDFGLIEESIIGRYTEMYDAYFADKPHVPEGRFHEVAMHDLEADPLGEMETLYDRLGLEGFATLQPKLARYVDSLRGYKKNRHQELPPRIRQRIAREWQRSFETWGYDPGADGPQRDERKAA